ncbi:MAG: hypothetical protein R2754_14340 [Microthrixaceae bacterium]
MSRGTVATALAGALAALGVRRTVGLDWGLEEAGLPHVGVEDPDLAVLLADADGRVNGGLGAALLAGGLLHLSSLPGGTAFPETVGSPEELLDTLAGLDATLPSTLALHVDLDLGAEVPGELVVAGGPDRQMAYRLGSSLRGARLAVIAGVGVVRTNSTDGLLRLAERLGVPVLNTLAAKGVFRWDSPYHAGTYGLQERDAELGGVEAAQVVIVTGVGDGELETPPVGNVVELDPRQLALAAEEWPRPEGGPAPRPPLYDALAAVIGPAYERTTTPLSAPRAALHSSGAAPDDGVVVAEADLAGFWLARAFPTAHPGSVAVATTPLPGFAAAGALMAVLAGRPALAIRSGGAGSSPAEAAVLELADALGVGVAVQAWAPEGPEVSPEDHARATEADYGAASTTVRHVGVALDDLEGLVGVAGAPVSWAGSRP